MNKRFLFALLVGIVLSFFAAHDNITNYIVGGFESLDLTEYQFPSGKSSFTMWIGISSMAVSTARELFFYLMPLLCLLPYAFSMRSEILSDYVAQPYTRAGRWPYCLSKAAAVFVSAGLVILIPLILNFVIVSCFAPARNADIYDFMYLGMADRCLWVDVFYTHPLLFVALRCMLDFLICGIWSLLVFGISFYVKNRVLLLVGSYIGLYIVAVIDHNLFLFLGNLNGVELSLFDLLQCLALYLPHNEWALCCELFIMFMTSLFLVKHGLKRDVL